MSAKRARGVEEAPERASESLARYRREANFIRALSRGTPLSLGILLAVVTIHAAVTLASAAGVAPGGEVSGALSFGAKIDALIEQGQWWRLVTGVFLHGGALHLIFNGYALYMLGPWVERLYGPRRFMLLFVGSGVAASAASFAFTDGPSVGASGAIFGLLGAMVVFGLKQRRRLPPRVARAFGVGLVPWVVVNLVIGFLPWLPVDNAAHVGGLLAGVALSLGMATPLQGEPAGWRRVGLEVGFALCWVALGLGLAFGVREALVCGGGRYFACYGEALGGP